VLASSYMDRHAAYVAMSRHRDAVSLRYGRDEFAHFGDLAAALRGLGIERTRQHRFNGARLRGARTIRTDEGIER